MRRLAAVALLCCLVGCDAREALLPTDAHNVVQHGRQWVTWRLTLDGRVYSFISKDDRLSDGSPFKTLLLGSELVKAEKAEK